MNFCTLYKLPCGCVLCHVSKKCANLLAIWTLCNLILQKQCGKILCSPYTNRNNQPLLCAYPKWQISRNCHRQKTQLYPQQESTKRTSLRKGIITGNRDIHRKTTEKTESRCPPPRRCCLWSVLWRHWPVVNPAITRLCPPSLLSPFCFLLIYFSIDRCLSFARVTFAHWY